MVPSAERQTPRLAPVEMLPRICEIGSMLHMPRTRNREMEFFDGYYLPLVRLYYLPRGRLRV